MSYLIFDLIVAAVLLIFLARGASRGMVLSLFGLLAIAVAFVGALLTARLVTPVIAQAVTPHLTRVIQEHLTELLRQTGQSTALLGDLETASLPLRDLLDSLRSMGIYESIVEGVEQVIRSGAAHTAAASIAQVAAALASFVVFRIVFVAAFILILILWTILSHTLDLLTRLPVLNLLNAVGGALLGLLMAVVFLFLAVWTLQVMGKVVPEATLQQTHLLKFFYQISPMDLLNGLMGGAA